MEKDSISKHIFEKILKKVHKNEKVKLYNLLIQNEVSDESAFHEIESPKEYIRILKGLINKEVIENQLNNMIEEIETGERWKVMSYFYLLHDDLNHLTSGDIELIVSYIIDSLCTITENKSEMDDYVNKNYFSALGKYNINDTIATKIKKLACDIVDNHTKGEVSYYEAYRDLINSVDERFAQRIKDYVLMNAFRYRREKFYESYNDGDFVPF